MPPVTDRTPAPDRLLLTQTVRERLFAHAREGARSDERDGGDERDGQTRAGDGASAGAGDAASGGASEAAAEVCGVLGGRVETGRANEGGVGDADGNDGGPGNENDLGGGDDETVARVTAVRRVPNVDDDPRFRYELDSAATVEAIDALEAEGLTHVGFYHSHPEGPRGPSRTDEARATWPGYVYLIVSLGAEPTIGAWRWSGEAFVQLPVAVDGE